MISLYGLFLILRICGRRGDSVTVRDEREREKIGREGQREIERERQKDEEKERSKGKEQRITISSRQGQSERSRKERARLCEITRRSWLISNS